MQEKDFSKIEVKKKKLYINVFDYEDDLVFPTYVSNQKFEVSMDLSLLIDDDKLNYMYINNFDRFMFHKTRNKNKKWFFKICLQCFSNENKFVLMVGLFICVDDRFTKLIVVYRGQNAAY